MVELNGRNCSVSTSFNETEKKELFRTIKNQKEDMRSARSVCGQLVFRKSSSSVLSLPMPVSDAGAEGGLVDSQAKG